MTPVQEGSELDRKLKQAKAHFDIGLDHMDNGRFAQGLRELRIAEGYDSKNPRIHVALAEAYLHQGKEREAESHLVRALQIHPEYHDARLNLAGLYPRSSNLYLVIATAQEL